MPSAPNIKVAVITGASGGIGRAASVSLYKTGWTVVLVARRQDALEETQRLLQGYDGASTEAQDGEAKRSSLVVADLSKVEDIGKVFAHVKETYGRLDLLFNNAGINVPAVPMEELSVEQYRSLMAVNVDACFYCAQEAVKIMKTQDPKGGRGGRESGRAESKSKGAALEHAHRQWPDTHRIINNGSISAYTPRVFSAPYTMSKHAILGLTKCLSLDGRADNIVCSQLDIGGAATDIQVASGTIKLQPNGDRVEEALFDVQHAGEAVAYMANLPLSVNILTQTIMANSMPYVGRG